MRLASREYCPTPTVFLGVGFETTIPTVAGDTENGSPGLLIPLRPLGAKTIHPPLKILAAEEQLNGFASGACFRDRREQLPIVTDYGNWRNCGFRAFDILVTEGSSQDDRRERPEDHE
jgi:hypothetical protein